MNRNSRYVYRSSFPQLPIPNNTPSHVPKINNIKPEFLKNCLHTYIYIWLKEEDLEKGKNSFWMFPLNVQEDLISGYLWGGYDWTYSEMKFDTIDSYF